MKPGFAALVFGLLGLTACASGPVPSASFQPKAVPGLTVEIGPEADGTAEVRLRGGVLGAAVISGHAVRAQEGWTLSLRRLDWFNNWPGGWTQASFLLDGTVQVESGPDGWTSKVVEAPLLDTVDSASIRYFDTHVRDDYGLAEFSHRWDRIQAVCADIRIRNSGPPPGSEALRKYLFPELYGYDTPPDPTHARVTVQGFEWDTDYTKGRFAGALGGLRDSGTLLRDYKESPGLWVLALNWKSLWSVN